ncbi:substrate-binding domain-containing protein, partial [Streptomyces sp. NPDC059744]|uniref:substrate-binding domain-containing protein n=1 Tax=Streptomyces sp. NPDC059744 TaxID=3346929 RepID=UPI003667FB07
MLNGRADVAPGTRTRVEELLLLHGYRRRRGSTAQSQLIDLVFHELDSGWAMEVVRGVENVAREEGLSLVLSESAGRLTPGQTWVDGVLARRPVGVILVLSDLTAAQRAQLTSRNIPFAVVDPAGDPGDDVPSVGTTNWQGGLAATRHLTGLGHRRIGVVSGPSRMMCSRARVDGYRAAMETAGLPIDPDLVREGEFSHEDGYTAGLELLRLPEPPTAIFAG